HRVAVAAPARRPGQVDDERTPDDPRDAPREQPVRRPRDRVGTDRLRDARRLTVEHRPRRFRRHVARRHAGAARGDDDVCGARKLAERRGDLRRLVRDDAPLDVVPVAAQELVEHVAARVGHTALRDAVGDGEDRGSHSFTFSTSSTLNDIPLSTAFAMSYTVSAATAAAVSASISTPVWAVVSADAVISTPSVTTRRSTATCVSGNGWHSGISSDVRFAAMIPAICAVVSASPFGSAPSRPTVSGAIRT